MAGMKFTADIDVEGIIKLRQEINKLKNSLKAVAGIPNSDAAIKQLEKEIEAATKKLEEYENKYLQIQKLKHDIDSSNDAVKKTKEETAALQSTNKWIVANTEAVIETDKQIKQLKKSFVSLSDSEKTGSSGTGILRQVQQLAAQRLVEEESIRRTIKAQKDQIIQSRAEEGSITALRKQIILLTKDYDDLGRTRRNGDAGKALLAQIANVQKELSAAEQASGRFQRNVGNYASAWNGLSFSVQQVARELPSLAVSANTFFLAISNNLPILVDEIAKARKEYAAFKAEIAAGNKDVKAVAPVWQQLTKSLISWQTALVVGLTLLSVYGKDMINWINTLSRSSDAVDGMIVRMQNLSKVMKDGAKQSAAERVELDILYKATQDHTRLLKERNDAADELQRKYPQYFGNLSNEAILAGNAAAAYKSLTDNILKAAQARSAMKIIEDNYNKIYQLQKAINADTNWTNRNRKKTKEGTASVTAVVGSSITGYTQTGEVLTEEAMEYNRRKKALKENTEAVNALKAANDALVKSIDVSAFVANNGSPLGTEDIDSLTDQQNKIAELMDKQVLEQKRSAEDMQMKIDEARIKAMDEGSKKTIAEIEFNFEKEMQAIDRQKEDLLRKKIDDARSIWEANPENKGKTFDATGISLSDSENQGFNEMYKIQIAAFEKNLKEYQSLQKDAWNEYYIEYGKYQEKRMAIMEKYDKQIAKAEEGSAEKATLTAQRKKELDDLDKDLLDSSELWSKFFTDFSNRSSSSIRSIIEDIQELIDYMNGVEGAQIPDIFKDNENTVKAINDAMSNPAALSKFTANLETSIKKFKKMLDENNPFKQITEGFKTKDSEGISKGFQGIASAAKELTGILEELGVESDSTAGKVTSVLGNTASYAATGASVGGPWGAIIGGAIGMATGLVGVLGADYSAYNKMKEEYASLIDVWDILISKKKEYVDISYGDEARKAGQEAIDILNKKSQAKIDLGIERLNSGASAGSHSIGVRIRKSMTQNEWDQWDEFARSIGMDPDAIGGRLTGLFSLTGEQLSKLQEDAPTFWAKLDDDVKGYLQDIIDCNEEIENMKEQLKETMTGVSFDSFYDNFVSTLSNMDKDSKDFADDFENYLKNAILSNLVANKYRSKIEELYNDWANKSDSNGDGIFDLTSSEADELRRAQQELAEEMIAERDAMAEVFGWTSSASSQESSKKGFATMSQDSADELNGRFTALQIAGEEIKNQNQLQTMSILDLKAGMLSIGANTSGIKDIAGETRDLIRLSYEAITDIRDNTNVMVKPIQQMAADIAEVKRNTNGLSKK
nr:MAG TPA_asm: tail length tape measure protein [Bacteriophage sp.]